MSRDSQPTDKFPLHRLMGVEILSTGSHVPEPIVRNEDLAALGCDSEWIVQRTGILERRHAPPEVATSDMAIAASRACLEQAGVRPDDIDLLIVGTFTGDMPVPSTACRVQDELGLRVPAMDLQAACAGFVYSLVTGMQFVATGCSQLALVIGADCNSRVVNPRDKKTYPLFGDGAGAVLLRKGDAEQGLMAYTLGADGSGAELLCCRMGGTRLPLSCEGLQQDLHWLHMDGKPVFKWAIRMLVETIQQVCNAAEKDVRDVDLFVLHQANLRILEAAASQLDLDMDRVVVNLDQYGNTSAGSVPLALDEVHRQGRLKRGDDVVISGFGAGLAWGTALLRW